ncbi:MAG: geranylgeranylglycerol-phosphate geranylgeranyltransferase [Bacteroidetes bacterium]|nr:geranylgeranylglycerol-phosphate geranylgeranyltransferase [Bacteroidota bacterium]
MILFTQVFAFYFLNPYVDLHDLLKFRFIALVLCTILVAASGYIINDYIDVKIDMANKPSNVLVGVRISRRKTIFTHWFLTSFAAILSLLINGKVFLLVVVCSLLLWMYSEYYKKSFLAGNLLVAMLTSFTLLILFLYDENLYWPGIISYSIFAFFTTLEREIIKDTEDIRGDEKFNSHTLPIRLGVRKTKDVILYLHAFNAILIFAFCYYIQVYFKNHIDTYILFLIYIIISVLLPMAVMTLFIKRADVKHDFSKLSRIAKIVMLLGIMSMVFWKI